MYVYVIHAIHYYLIEQLLNTDEHANSTIDDTERWNSLTSNTSLPYRWKKITYSIYL